MNFDQFRKTLLESTKKNAADAVVCKRVLSQTANFLKRSNAVSNSGAGLESLGGELPVMNSQVRLGDNGLDLPAIRDFVKGCYGPKDGVKDAAMESVILEVARILDAKGTYQNFFNTGRTSSSDNMLSAYQVTGPYAYGSILNDEKLATESFGVDMDRINADARLNIVLAVLRPYTGLLDRVLPRVPQTDNRVTLKIPAPETYDLESSMSRDGAVRNNGSHRIPLANLFRNPGAVSTAPRRITLRPENDVGTPNVLWQGLPKVGPRINLFDLASDATRVGFDKTDYTDTVSEGGRVASVFVRITKPAAGSDPKVEEIFKIPTAVLAISRFGGVTNNADSADRVANINYDYPLNSATKMSNGGTSVLLADYDAPVQLMLDIAFTATTNLKTSATHGAGSVQAKPYTADQSAIPADIATAFAGLQFDIIAYEPELYYSEENMRKTTLAARMNYREMRFEIPVGRTFVVDHSLLQDEAPEDVIALINTMLALGNSQRGLEVLESHMRDVNERNKLEASHPEIGYIHRVATSYAAGTVCLPHVVINTLDYADEPSGNEAVAVMRESERMTELHAKLRARMLLIVANLAQRSLYNNSLNPNELPVYKIVTSTVLCALLFGISDYHNELNDRAKEKPVNVTYSMELPNGVRLDVVGTDFDNFKDKIMMFPVREDAPTDVTSFANIHDRGTYSGQITVTQNGSVFRRAYLNSREIPFVTNPVGALVSVEGLEDQLTSIDI